MPTTVTTFDAILSGMSWNGVDVAGRPTFLTYSFDTVASPALTGMLSGAFLASFQPLSAAEQDIARQALKTWADVSGLTLFEVPPGQGDIRFGLYDFRLGGPDTEDAAGFAYYPAVLNYDDGAQEYAYGGDIFLNIGNADFDTIVHEIGHALGLKHPFEDPPILDPSLDDLAHTVMTYNPTGGPATQLGSLDVQAIQYLYGLQSADGTQAASWSWDAQRYVLIQTGGSGADTLAGVAVADRINAGPGNDYVMARAGADIINGEDGDDTLAGGDDADTLSGGTGNDVVDGDSGDDSISGGDGDDDLWGLGGADTMVGEAGADTLHGGSGANRLHGGAGNDQIIVRDGSSTVDGGEGYDSLVFVPLTNTSVVLSYASFTAGGGSFTGIETISLYGLDYADTLQGGAMPDYLIGGAGADSLFGGASDDELYGDTGADTLSGGDGNDYLEGWSGDDLIIPGDGADDIWGGSGNDTVDYSVELQAVDVTINAPRQTLSGIETMQDVENLIGTAYGDRLIGDAGPNRLFGGGGADTVQGGDGTNYLRGDDGDDSIVGGAGFDDINGNVGDDAASGGAGDDWVVGGKGADRLFGDDGADLVYGNLGSDTCDGGAGNDIVRGGQDNDSLTGGAGSDYVSGDKGDDTVAGGAGADIFHTFGDAGIDRVVDFSLAEGDRVQLDPGTQYTVAQVGSDTVISMTGGGQMILVGVALSTLTGNWIFGA